jgi:phage terminase large subunit
MSALSIPTARVFEPLLHPKRYKGAVGGRGSGKSHFFAGLLIEDAFEWPGNYGSGLRAVGIREVQKDLGQSSKRLLEDKIYAHNLVTQGFRAYDDVISTPGDGLIIFKGMNNFNADSIKSLEGYARVWWEEAHGATQTSMDLLRPTIRSVDSQGTDISEIWFSWNRRKKSDAVDKFFLTLQAANDPDFALVTANYRDNPFWNAALEKERQLTLRDDPDGYEHIWEGAYATVSTGAYFAKGLLKAKLDGRIHRVAADPLLTTWAFWDIGGAGAKADAMAIWIVQFVGDDIRVLDYIEGQGQTLAYYVNELRQRGWGNAKCKLPHDGTNVNNITGKKYADHLRDAEFDVTVVPNQGPGAAKQRIEAVRRLFPKIVFNDTPAVESGRAALGWYHEKVDERREIGLGPDHDWSSHCADAFGLMAICYEEPARVKRFNRPLVYPKRSYA